MNPQFSHQWHGAGLGRGGRGATHSVETITAQTEGQSPLPSVPQEPFPRVLTSGLPVGLRDRAPQGFASRELRAASSPEKQGTSFGGELLSLFHLPYQTKVVKPVALAVSAPSYWNLIRTQGILCSLFRRQNQTQDTVPSPFETGTPCAA